MVSAARRSSASTGGATAKIAAISRSSRRGSGTGVLSPSELRSDVAFPLAVPERNRLRPVRLRQEAAALAPPRRRRRVLGVSVFHVEHCDAARRRRRTRRRALAGGSGGLVTRS